MNFSVDRGVIIRESNETKINCSVHQLDQVAKLDQCSTSMFINTLKL